MADTTSTVYGLVKPEVGASEDTWGTKLNTNLDALDDLLSGSTTLQGAKLDDTTKIVDNADATKIVALSAGSLTTATTRTFTFPDATGTFVLADNTATLTNKTLTSPAIVTGFTFDGTTVTALSGADTTVVTGTAGTSGNVATWNADGDIVDGGYAKGGLVFISSQTASTSATLDFTGFSASTYGSYLFVFDAVTPATDGTTFACRYSTDAGSSFVAGTNYKYTLSYRDTGDSVNTFATAAIESNIAIAGDVDNAATSGVSGELRIINPGGTNYTASRGEGQYFASTGLHGEWEMSGVLAATTAVDAVRFLMLSGNIASGTITMYGLRNS